MSDFVASLIARLADLLAPAERRLEPIALPIRRDEWRGPHRGDRRN